jgi:hypothetical protein
VSYTVDRVRKETSYTPRVHEHIEGVCTTSGTHFTRREVVDSMRRGEGWMTRGPDGSSAVIKPMNTCPVTGCPATPYITTAPDHTTANNLDNLPRC